MRLLQRAGLGLAARNAQKHGVARQHRGRDEIPDRLTLGVEVPEGFTHPAQAHLRSHQAHEPLVHRARKSELSTEPLEASGEDPVGNVVAEDRAGPAPRVVRLHEVAWFDVGSVDRENRVDRVAKLTGRRRNSID